MISQLNFNFRDLMIAASLKLAWSLKTMPPNYHFRDLMIAASLKLRRNAAREKRRNSFPRSDDRGLIEAGCGVSADASDEEISAI